MGEIVIKEKSINAPVEVFGHTFKGLQAIKQAVELESRVEKSIFGKRNIYEGKGKGIVPGIHILRLYEPYPCFDAEDYATEHRQYSNYFFSTEPFDLAMIEKLANRRHLSNARLVYADTPEWALPAIYYGGYGDKMIAAMKVE